jgi:hypothetical protein
MSTATPDADDVPPRPRNYRPGTGADRYVRFAEDWLGLTVPEPQRTILEAFEQHRRVLVVGANGYGKSYGAAAGGIAGLYTNPDTIVNITSGSYGQLDDTIWKPIKSLHRSSKLPGRTLDNTRELRTELDEEWFLKCLSPQYPADLEGRHNARMLYIIEEADKPGIKREHIDSAESTLTDEDDRMLVIANPPEDESNVVAELMDHDGWHTLQFASWDARNVRVDAGEHDGPKIPGLVDLSEVRENWADWNGEAWPGIDQARTAHERRDDLDVRWYRRRAGIMPPGEAAVHRPLEPAVVDAAYQPDATPARETPQALGVDVARSGDDTVAVGPHDDHLVVEYAQQGTDHTEQEQALAATLREWPALEIAVDAVGEGSGLADGLDNRFGATRFKAQATAVDETTYDDRWSEALAHFADYLEAGGTFSDSDLYEQAMVAARTITWSERHLASRGLDGADVLSASPKDDVRERLGRSPDHFDAAIMACWRDGVDPQTEKPAPTW